MRPSRPWWKQSHRCFYVKVRGQLIRLDPDLEKSRTMHQALIVQANASIPINAHTIIYESKPPALTVAALVDLYLRDCGRRWSLVTMETTRGILARWRGHAGEMAAGQVRAYHLHEWADGQDWGPSTRHRCLGVIRTMLTWGHERGYVPSLELGRLRLPRIKATNCMTEEQAREFEASIRSELVRDYWALGTACGARPGEMLSLRASGISQDGRWADVVGKRGARRVCFATRAVPILERLCAAYPAGPILRGFRGRELSRRMLWDYFRTTRGKDGLATPKQTRKLFASRLVRAGVDSTIVATLLGHQGMGRTGTDVLFRHYLLVDEATLLAAVDRA